MTATFFFGRRAPPAKLARFVRLRARGALLFPRGLTCAQSDVGLRAGAPGELGRQHGLRAGEYPATQPPSHPATEVTAACRSHRFSAPTVTACRPVTSPPGFPRSQPAGRSHPSSVTSPPAGHTPPNSRHLLGRAAALASGVVGWGRRVGVCRVGCRVGLSGVSGGNSDEDPARSERGSERGRNTQTALSGSGVSCCLSFFHFRAEWIERSGARLASGTARRARETVLLARVGAPRERETVLRARAGAPRERETVRRARVGAPRK
jgi:hypothetical protein